MSSSQPENHTSHLEVEKMKRSAARTAVTSNALLTALKLTVAVVTGSVSVLAETVNSAGDMLGSAIAYGTVRAADTPPDSTHAYGHGKFENLSGAVIAMLVIGGGAYTFGEAIKHLIRHTEVAQADIGIAVMAISAIANFIVSQRLLGAGKRTDSPALTADGKHLQTDILTSLAALAGLILTRVTGAYWIDPMVAMVISLLVFWVGAQIAREAVLTLSDTTLPAHEQTVLREAIESEPRVLGYHKLRTRKAGSHRHIDVHVQIDDQNSFVEAHEFGERLEEKLRATLPNVHPIIHMEPYEAEAKHQKEVHGEGSG